MPDRTLIVTVPYWKGTNALWSPLLDDLAADPAFATCDFLHWEYRLSNAARKGPARSLARTLSGAIHEKWVAEKGYRSVVLIGHSLGGLLCRQAYLFASGAEIEFAPRYPWAERLERMVLFAGMSRGLNWEDGWRWWRVAGTAAYLVPSRRLNLVQDLLRGSAFLTNLRIQWIRHFAALGERAPTIVQVLGTQDGIVTRDDSIDVEQFPTAYHIDVAGATHGNVVCIQDAQDRGARYKLFRGAILDPVPPESENQTIEGAEHVVFLTHGIRAFAFSWPAKAERLIRARLPGVEIVKPTEGFFSALRFAWPISRKNHLRLFRDRYSEQLARNPNASCYYIGHSNGTYLLGENLRLVPGMRFERAVIAASVLPPTYPWEQVTHPTRGQIKHVHAEYAAGDWPVALLCSALNQFGMKDVGPGGFQGFFRKSASMTEVGWHRGGHTDVVEDENLARLVDQALGIPTSHDPSTPPTLRPAPSRWLLMLMPWAGLLAAVIVLVLIAGLGWYLFYSGIQPLGLRIGIAAGAVLLLLFALDSF